MLALFLRFREVAVNGADGTWLPKGAHVPMVPANVMLIALLPLCVFAQWAVYSAKRDDRPHTGTALFLVLLLGIALINAQAYIWATMGLAANGGTYNIMFYAVTGVTTALCIVGVVFSAITAFRYLSGREADREVVSAHALYWYCFSAIFALVWFVVYVTK
jgi:heme/copper-type cytochrome/quinol oxidase subunit 3